MKVLLSSIDRFGRLAYPMRGKVTTHVLLGSKRKRRSCSKARAGRAGTTRKAEQSKANLLFMILATFVDLERAVNLLDEDEPSQLMGEGQFREADLCQGILSDRWWEPVSTADDKAEP